MFSANTSQVSNDVKYIEDFFSAWLRTGTGSSQTVTTGIKENTGALVISKSRSAATDWAWYDTFRGATKDLASNTTAAETTQSQGLTAFNTDGHTWGTLAKVNTSGATYVDFVLKPTPKFFDVVTWTGNGSARTIAHNLGSVPGCIIIKSTTAATSWAVYHTGLGNGNFLTLNSANASTASSAIWNSTSPTATVFTIGTAGAVNDVGQTYVAYLFAHNAGGFGLTGTDNVISCGSFTTDGSGNATVTLGYEPQWVLYKPSAAVNNWKIFDNMRGMVVGNGDQALYPNTSGAEVQDDSIQPAATGFSIVGGDASATHIYIAIRRGPMKTPTTGTSVLGLNARTGTGANATVTGGAGVTDLAIIKNRGAATNWVWTPRLTGTGYLSSNATTAETAAGTTILQANPWDVMDGIKVGTTSTLTNASSNTFINYLIKRAPGFMDVVCYTGTGVARTVAHNLGVAPELMIVKSRSTVNSWPVWNPDVFAIDNAYITLLNSTIAVSNSGTSFNSTAPTSTVFTVGTNANTNGSGVTYVAYLFSSCPGVSKVGSYTGTGTTQQINCGFTGGARFVLIKRIASAGGAPAGADWYFWDSARGIVAGNDPYLLLNSTAAEVTTTDYIDTFSSGFEISSTAPAEINASGGTFIFLAIA